MSEQSTGTKKVMIWGAIVVVLGLVAIAGTYMVNAAKKTAAIEKDQKTLDDFDSAQKRMRARQCRSLYTQSECEAQGHKYN